MKTKIKIKIKITKLFVNEIHVLMNLTHMKFWIKIENIFMGQFNKLYAPNTSHLISKQSGETIVDHIALM